MEKKGKAAKAVSERKAAREEMCKQITVYAAAEIKWVKFTESNVSTCGIPPQIAQQLKNVHGHTEQTKEKICQPGASDAPAAPSLTDALGTARLPTPETTKTGNGTLDTLTGNAIHAMTAAMRPGRRFDRQLGRSASAGGCAALSAARPARSPDRVVAAADPLLVVIGPCRDLRRGRAAERLASRPVLRRRLRHARGGLHLERYRRSRP